MSFTVHIYGGTDVGKQRDHNEDSFRILCNKNNEWSELIEFEKDISETKGIIAVVADGMGGTNAGEIASEIAVNTVKEEIISLSSSFSEVEDYANFLLSIVTKAHKNIVTRAKENKELQGMGTTIVLAWIVSGFLYVVWSGDSRCYYYNKKRDSKLAPFTDDHSLVWTLVKNGKISPEEARLSENSNLILQSLGDNNQKPNPEFNWTKLENDDRILICSDGLNSMLSDIGIQQILDFSNATKDTCLSLINAANNAGGVDNITVILIDVKVSDKKYPHQIITKNKKRSLLFKISLFVILTIITLGIVFHKYLYEVYQNLKLRTSDTEMSSKISISDPEVFVEDSSNNYNIENHFSQYDSNNTKISDYSQLIDENTKESSENKKHIDSLFLKSELTKALKTIEYLNQRIAQFEPNGSSFKKEFYLEKSAKFDYIKYNIDSLADEIKKIAQVNINEVITIFDYQYAEKIFIPINESLTGFREEIKEITETK